MRNFAKIVLLSVALLTNVVANASKKMSVEVSSPEILTISLEGVTKGEVLTISSAKGEVVYNEVLNELALFTKTLHISDLKQGVYNVRSTTEDSVKITPFIVVPSQSKIIRGTTKTFSTPVIEMNGTRAKIKVNNADKHNIDIRVYSKRSSTELDIVKNDTRDVVYKTYDFANLGTGTYEIVITVGKEVFTETYNF